MRFVGKLLILALWACCSAGDWLIEPVSTPARASIDGCILTLSNTLVSRTFSLPATGCQFPNFATLDLTDQTQHPPKSVLSALEVEATVELDGVRWAVGGFNQTCPDWQTRPPKDPYGTCAFLNRTQPTNSQPSANASAWMFTGYHTGPMTAPFHYVTTRHGINTPWPPTGVHLQVNFSAPPSAPAALHGLTVTVHYELPQGIPAIRKWVSISTHSSDTAGGAVRVGDVMVDSMRVNDDYAGTSYPIAGPWRSGSVPLLYITTEAAHGASCVWGTRPESTYSSNPYYECSYTGTSGDAGTCHPYAKPAEVCAGSGVQCPQCGEPICPCPKIDIPGGAHVKLSKSTRGPSSDFVFNSFKSVLLLFDSTEQERRGLMLRQLTTILYPWTTENPLFLHLTDTSAAGVKQAVDDARSVGMEMIIESFWSGFQMENTSPLYLKKLQASIKYANENGIELGGYDLIDLDRKGLGYDQEAISVDGRQTGSACFASKWVDFLVPVIDQKVSAPIGLSMVETDGPYGGGACASTNHSHHEGLLDSVYWQTRLQSEFFISMREKGVFVNAPDHYFAQGSNKMMFYGDPTNFAKPRKMDLLLSRQMLFDATFEWLPTQGWSLVPIINYNGGGVEAFFNPLEENVKDYDLAWATYMGYGVAGVCWRGPRIFTGERSKAVVVKWVSFYKKYRSLLTGPRLIHVRRPDGQNLDGVMHVASPSSPSSPSETKIRGLVFLWNPTVKRIVANVTLPLYYTDIIGSALLLLNDDPNAAVTLPLARDSSVPLPAVVEANSYAWWTVYSSSQ